MREPVCHPLSLVTLARLPISLNSSHLHPPSPPTPHARYRDSDIFVKADDDIVFIDVGKFGDFLQGVTYEHVHFPNIVNNDAGLAIQAARNAHPMVAAWVREYERQGVNFTRR